MRFIKPVSGGTELPELSNPAGASNIQVGYEAIGSAGQKITGTHVEQTSLDTSDATASAADMAEGMTAYVNGKKITGSVAVPDGKSLAASYRNLSGGNIKIGRTNTSDFLLRSGKTFEVYDSADNFGDATADDVAAGKTFTSAAGLKVAGTKVAQTLAEMTADADAAAGDIVSGKKAYVAGELVTGTLVPAEGKFADAKTSSFSISSKSHTISGVSDNGLFYGEIKNNSTVVGKLIIFINNGSATALESYAGMGKTSVSLSDGRLTITQTTTQNYTCYFSYYGVV